MQARIKQGKAKGRIQAPPSKSMAHRYLICAALSEGESVITNVAYNQDILATLDCIRAYGASVTTDGDTVRISGIRPPSSASRTFPCRESGSTLRFFIPIAMLSQGQSTFTGSETLLGRPLSVYEDMIKKSGGTFQSGGGRITLEAVLTNDTLRVPGDISSQFITGLLFALAATGRAGRIEIAPPVESRPYINMTLQAMRRFGIDVDWQNDTTLTIAEGCSYKPAEVRVEGDYSNAAFLDALNVIGGDVTVLGMDPESLQGDKVYAEHFAAIGRGFAEIDLTDCPDLGPILMATAAACEGAHFTGTRRLAIKESDRGKVMCTELERFGVKSERKENEITVFPSHLAAPVSMPEGHNDHRIVMSIATLLTLTGGCVQGAEAVRKSYPDYFDRLRELGIEVEIHE